MTTETIIQQTEALPLAFHVAGQAQSGSMDVKNGPFIGFVASLLMLIAVAVWQFSVLTSDARVGGYPAGGKAESGVLDHDQVKPALSQPR
jgi:hypothetical protein